MADKGKTKRSKPGRPRKKGAGARLRHPKTVEPWAQMVGEPPRSYELFQAYRDLGQTRKVNQLVDEAIGGRKTGLRQLYKYSREYDWQNRARAWDRKQDKAKRDGQLKAIRRMNYRHAKAGAKGVAVLEAMYAEFERRVEEEERFLQRLPADDFIDRLVKVMTNLERMTKVERQARGEPGETIGVSGPGAEAAEKNAEFYRMVQTDPDAFELWTALQERLAVLYRMEQGDYEEGDDTSDEAEEE